MSAARHAQDAHAEAQRLGLALEDLCAALLLGVVPSAQELGSLRNQARFVQYNTARTLHAVTIFPPVDRRDVTAVIPAMAGVEA